MERKNLEARAGMTIFASTGMIGNKHLDRMSTPYFYKAVEGSKIILLNTNYFFNVATYSLNFDDIYIYTYSYKEEESWTTYNNDLTGNSYRQKDYLFLEEVYFRVCLKRVDGQNFTDEEAENINEILLFLSKDTQYQQKAYFLDEAKETVSTIRRKRIKKSLVFGLLSDSHYTVNGTWEDTIYNMKEVNNEVHFDGIVHLGDLTDGMVEAEITRKYATKVLNDLKKINVPLYVAIGNHDTNYFNNNPEPFSEKEQYEIYQYHSDKYVNRNVNELYYFVDFDNELIRCMFLTSFDYREKIRYGFLENLLTWVQETLDSTPSGYSVIIFSHEAPIAILDYWSDVIRNGDKLMSILEAYNSQEGKKIMAFIHGHTHADYIYTKREFPIISIGCAKCEYFTDKKPDGSITYKRYLNTLTQELWDTVIITPSESRIDFIRFGAGEDRTVYC